ncbi:MAG: LytTR family transcriptional regulator [Clostridiales Family XIII bacterium]|jgi:DNA-binding LytR/AlgR family response regulator|nr:LytTR family transcriptional regulator [Clostridiales Family XIII bacterium]
MKIRIDIDHDANEPEVIIRCRRADEDVLRVQKAVLDALPSGLRLKAARDGKDYYLTPEDVLFFESEGGRTWAHTRDEVFEVRLRLYELEDLLPHGFVRVSKSAIVCVAHIYSVARNITGPSVVSFRGSHKRISASRQYYGLLRDKLDEMQFGR